MRAEIIEMPTDRKLWFLVREKDIQFLPIRLFSRGSIHAVSLDMLRLEAPGLTWDQALAGVATIGSAEVPDGIVELAVYRGRQRLILSESGVNLLSATVAHRKVLLERIQALADEFPAAVIAEHLRNEHAYFTTLESILRRRGLH
jgi:hypothetical protein